MINMIWPIIQSHSSRPQTLDEIEYLIAVIRDKGKENYGN